MPSPTPRNPATQHRQDTLDELTAIGMRLARAIDARVENEPDSIADMATAFDRVSRAVRRTVALAHHLDQAVTADKRAAARRLIIRTVEDAIEQHAGGSPRAERLNAELQERLDSPDLDADIATRPVTDIIGDICRDFGLENVYGMRLYRRRTPADIAALSARAAQPARAPRPPADPPPTPERFVRTVPSPNGA